MILSDRSIKEMISCGFMPDGLYVGPSSVDLTLSDSFQVIPENKEKIVLGEKVNYYEFTTDSAELPPGGFALASTAETIYVPDGFAAYVEGRSSVGRAGLQIQNAGFIDAGFYGQITLELANQTARSIILNAGIRICQIVYVKMDSNCENPYKGKYNGQIGATESRLHKD